MLPNIIIEGPEGSGKTTAAVELTKKLGYNYYHDGPPDPAMIDERNFLKYYAIVMESFRSPWVWDRSIYGELVYGPIFRNSSRVELMQVVKFLSDWRAMKGRDIITVLLYPPWGLVRENWAKNNNDQIQKANSEDWNRNLVKKKLLDDSDSLSRVYSGYGHIQKSFDHTIFEYPTMRHWIEVLS